RPVEWDGPALLCLVTVDWAEAGALIVVQSRDQRRMRLLSADPPRGTTAVLREDTDEHWVDIVAGVPGWTGDSRIVWTADSDGARRLLVATPQQLTDGTAAPVTPVGLQVRGVADIDGDTVLVTASEQDPTEVALLAYGPDGLAEGNREDGVHTGRRTGGTTVVLDRSLAAPGVAITVRTENRPGEKITVTSLAENPTGPTPRPDLFSAGERGIRTALVLPSWHEPGSGKLPVLMDPYGGPHMQRVVAAQSAFAGPQWFAEQG